MPFPDSRLNPSLPIPEKQVAQTLLAATQAAAAYTSTAPFSVIGARAITLFIDADAAASGDRLALNIAVSNSELLPAAGADEWFLPVVTDGSVTIGAGGGAVATGVDWTLLPAGWGLVVLSPGEYRFPAFSGASEEGRWAVSFDVSRFRHVWILYADIGGATRGTYAITVAQST